MGSAASRVIDWDQRKYGDGSRRTRLSEGPNFFPVIDVAGLAAVFVCGWTVLLLWRRITSVEEQLLTTTFLKRQKEMKRVEKSKMKEQQRAQRKLDKAAKKDSGQSGPEIDMNPPELDIFNEIPDFNSPR